VPGLGLLPPAPPGVAPVPEPLLLLVPELLPPLGLFWLLFPGLSLPVLPTPVPFPPVPLLPVPVLPLFPLEGVLLAPPP